VVSLLGVAGFDLFVEGLRGYRDRQMGFEHVRPQYDNHATFSMVYLGIGVFENSLGIDDTDKFVWNRDLIEAKVELPLFGGHPDTWVRRMFHAKISHAVPARVPPTDGRVGSGRPNAGRVRPGVRAVV
jgi:hypothetical protein